LHWFFVELLIELECGIENSLQVFLSTPFTIRDKEANWCYFWIFVYFAFIRVTTKVILKLEMQ